ncbi:MAG: hypothetical protein IT306_05340 [Chloroflexi bacterium]|nr:hypothetical protein [Chloroflexota bacterium]
MQDDHFSSPDRGDRIASATLPTIVHVVVGADGTLIVQYVIPSTSEAVKVTFMPDGSYSLLQVHDSVWREIGIDFGIAPRGRGPAMTIRTAASQPDGSVLATLLSTSLRGQQVRRSLRLQPDGAWDTDYDRDDGNGRRVLGAATRGANATGRVTRQRRKLDAGGTMLWTAESETQQILARPNRSGLGWSGASVPMLRTIGTATYADTSVGSSTVVAYFASDGDGGGGPAAPAPGRLIRTSTEQGPHWTRTQQTFDGPGKGETTVDVTSYNNGRKVVETQYEEWGTDVVSGTPLIHPTVVDKTREVQYPNGTKEVSHDREVIHVGEHRPDIDPGGETDHPGGAGMYTKTWEHSGVDQAGNVTESRGAETHSGAGTSISTSTKQSDGGWLIVTTTTDKNGNGQRTTSRVDKNGNPQGPTTTEPVGKGSGGSSTGGGSGSGGESGGDNSDAGGNSNGGNSNNGAGDPDPDSGEEGSPLGDEGGPSGSGWGNDGPLSLLPGHAGRAFGSAITIDDPLADPEHDEYRTVPTRMAAGVTYDALVNPGVAYGGQGDERGGSEGAPDAHPAIQTTMILDTVPIPPEEGFEWDNPEVQYTFVADTITALKRSGNLDAATLKAVEMALADVSAIADRIASAKRATG